MGEFADYAVDECLTAEELRFEFRQGRLSYSEAYDEGIIDELGYEARPYTRVSTKTCRRCKKPGLIWGKTDHGWRLFEGKVEHVCTV